MRPANDNDMVVTLTVGQLRQLVREAAHEGAERALARKAPAILTCKQLAELLGQTPENVRRLAKAGMPHTRIGTDGDYRFVQADVEAWMQRPKERRYHGSLRPKQGKAEREA